MFGEKTQQSSIITGTSAYTLDAAVGAFKTWRSQVSDLSAVFYCAENGDGTIWEIGYGTLTYGSPDTISRTLISSSTGSLISWVGGDAPIYVFSCPVAVAIKHMLNPINNTRPAWLQAGGMWLDYTIGIGTTWVKKLATSGIAGGDAEMGRLDVANKIYMASNAAAIRDTTTSGSTIGVNDRGYIVSHDTSAAVRVAALPAVATATAGFYVGIYADGIFPVFLDTNGAEAIDNAVVPPGKVVWVRCTGTKWLTQGTANQALIGRRQTVTAGPLSSGAPNLLATVSGLALSTSNVAAATPLILRASNGDLERWGLSTANVSFGTLGDNTTTYLLMRPGVDGVLAGVPLTLAPVIQESGTPAVTSGQYTFNWGEMKGYLGNGSAAVPDYLVPIGEAVTSGGNVTAVTAYAYNGRYDSGFTATLTIGGVSKNCNIGADPSAYSARYVIQCTTADQNFAVGDVITNGVNNASTNSGIIPVICTRNTVALGALSNQFTSNKTTGSSAAALTLASWKYKFVVDRGW